MCRRECVEKSPLIIFLKKEVIETFILHANSTEPQMEHPAPADWPAINFNLPNIREGVYTGFPFSTTAMDIISLEIHLLIPRPSRSITRTKITIAMGGK